MATDTRRRPGVPPFGEPSQFWLRRAQTHAEELARYGIEATKRQQALRYFTWRWQWSAVRQSRQLRFLLRHSPPWTIMRCLLTPARLSGRAWHAVPWDRRDRWLYVFAVRLLWHHARRRDVLGVVSLPEPELGGPLPVRSDNRLISQDLANSSLEANAIARALDGRRPKSILEVGAGYGRTAYALLTLYREARYTVVDIEPALTIARWYLTSLFEPARLRFLHPEEAEELATGSTDLAISISSLQEMRRDQLARYLELFDDVAAGGVVYLKQWERWTNAVDGVTLAFNEYPLPPRWRVAFNERAPVQTNFRQAAWAVPSR
jgi:putative sugar O-methyltransferase